MGEPGNDGSGRGGRRQEVRSQIALAAMDLFAEQGFESTTVDRIAEQAGVGRRTFFRYFRSKEDAVFPGHDERLADVVERLRTTSDEADPLQVLTEIAGLVLDMYVAEPQVSLKRFELTRQVGALRDKEIASIDRYQRVFARYLRRCWAAGADAELHAAMAAAAVVAAHNQVLRSWLRAGGSGDPHVQLRVAMAVVREKFGGRDPGAGEVVVGVVRTSAPANEVRGRVEDALRHIAT
ncbi:TetR family transcriptional regulator [Saccharopolyspora sp. HNM0983]|uniref:TetR family transcriptional regulator n=1 Tax=Saccharopolyspora montiporae TaxID=2781240 RepID=A0A929BE07_9PSEU|nr:TetR family transcriptional regulator [Saccharopolyspora sp. HNM0983]MBE9376331.1 TetR family transcriptional regulator [Saccharopolyspora sp. HNM0983]